MLRCRSEFIDERSSNIILEEEVNKDKGSSIPGRCKISRIKTSEESRVGDFEMMGS